MDFIVSIDASRSKHADMDATLLASIGQVQSADDVATNSSSLVVLAPIYIGATCAACTVQNMCGFDSIQLGNHPLSVLHANGGGVDGLALVFEQGLEVTGNPSVTTPYQEDVLGT